MENKDWKATPAQRVQWNEGLATLEQIKCLLSMFRDRCPAFAQWVDARESESDGIAGSFKFFLSCEMVPAACPFASWIDHPRILLEEIHRIAKLLDVSLKQEVYS